MFAAEQSFKIYTNSVYAVLDSSRLCYIFQTDSEDDCSKLSNSQWIPDLLIT